MEGGVGKWEERVDKKQASKQGSCREKKGTQLYLVIYSPTFPPSSLFPVESYSTGLHPTGIGYNFPPPLGAAVG